MSPARDGRPSDSLLLFKASPAGPEQREDPDVARMAQRLLRAAAATDHAWTSRLDCGANSRPAQTSGLEPLVRTPLGRQSLAGHWVVAPVVRDEPEICDDAWAVVAPFGSWQTVHGRVRPLGCCRLLLGVLALVAPVHRRAAVNGGVSRGVAVRPDSWGRASEIIRRVPSGTHWRPSPCNLITVRPRVPPSVGEGRTHPSVLCGQLHLVIEAHLQVCGREFAGSGSGAFSTRPSRGGALGKRSFTSMPPVDGLSAMVE